MLSKYSAKTCLIALCAIVAFGSLLTIKVILDSNTAKPLRYMQRKTSETSYASKILNKVFQETCANTEILQNMPVNNKRTSSPIKPYPILLLVTFNKYQYYETIPYIELLYRDYFESILYCGPSKPPEHMVINFQMKYIMFEQRKSDMGGSYIYNCTMQAIKMNYNAKGILYMSDDVILKVESIREFDWNEIWLSNHIFGERERRNLYIGSYDNPMNTSSPKLCDKKSLALPCKLMNRHISPFITKKTNILNVYAELLERMTLEEMKEDKLFTYFLQALEERTGGKKRFFKTIADIYYLPRYYWDKFHRLAEIFLKHEVHMELAVPNILHGIETLKDHPVTLLQARNFPRSFMIPILFQNKDWYAWHPFKLGPMARGHNDTIQAYCSLFHGYWYRHPQSIK